MRKKSLRFILNFIYSQEMNSAGGSTEYSENLTIGFPKPWLERLANVSATEVYLVALFWT